MRSAIAGDVYGGAFRRDPELVAQTLRHVRFSSAGGYYLQLAAHFGWTSLPWLSMLRQPTLVMAGADDPLVPTINARIMRWLIPDARLVIVDCGHLFLVTLPAESARIVDAFLRSPTRAARPRDRTSSRTLITENPMKPSQSLARRRPTMRRFRSGRSSTQAAPRLRRRKSSTVIGVATRTGRSWSGCSASPRRSTRWASSPGATVAMMDWDSHRYLECFFAVPMMGAVLHTVNIRISPEQVLYTINHAKDDVILVNAEFLPLLEGIHSKIRPGVKLVLINDGDTAPTTSLSFAAEYESMLERAAPSYAFPDLGEDTRATTFYTTGTTGLPKGVYYSHRQLVLHTLGTSVALANAPHAAFTARDVYMPITPMFHVHAWGFPYVATMLGVKQVYPGRYVPERLLGLVAREQVTFSHCVPTILQMMLGSPASRQTGSQRLEDDHRRLRAAAAARARSGRAWHRHHRRLRDVGDVPDPHACASASLAARRCRRRDAALPLQGRPADSVRATAHRRRKHERCRARRR